MPPLIAPDLAAIQASYPSRKPASVTQSSNLFQGKQEIVIRHDGQDYRLRVTRQNKLILTK